MRTLTPRRAFAAAALLLSVATVAAAAQRAFADVSGKWSFAVVTPDQTMESLMTLKQEGETLSGNLDMQQMGNAPAGRQHQR